MCTPVSMGPAQVEQSTDTHTLTCGTTCIVAAVDSVYTSVSPLAFLAWSHDYCGCHGNEQGGSWQSKDLEIFISERT